MSERHDIRLKWLVAGLAVLALITAGGFLREFLQARQIDREISALKAEAESLKVRNFQISSLQASLRSGEFIEREARTKLGLQKEGERVVVLKKEENRPATSPKEEGLASRSLGEGWSNSKKWWTYFADPHAFREHISAR